MFSPTFLVRIHLLLVLCVLAVVAMAGDNKDNRELQDFGDNEVLSCLAIFFPISLIFCPFALLLNFVICPILGPTGFCADVLG